MARDADALISYIRSRSLAPDFRPCSYYGPEEDAVVFYFRNDPDYAKRINQWLTLYLSLDSDELVGCQIKGVGRVLENLDTFGIDVVHGKVKLSLIFFAFIGGLHEDEEVKNHLRAIGHAAKQTDSELDVPELV